MKISPGESRQQQFASQIVKRRADRFDKRLMAKLESRESVHLSAGTNMDEILLPIAV